jgi:hypothetical protein
VENTGASADHVIVTSDDCMKPAVDLFDHATSADQPAALLVLIPPIRVVPSRDSIRPAKIWFAVTAGIALALIFRLPLVALVAAPLAGVAVALLAWRWPQSRSVAATLVAAAFLAQVTSIFVSPFTWPLRFGFFAVLLGALVLFLPSPAREL